MRTLVGIDSLEPPEEGVAVTVGTFDGVHVGHRALIEQTRNDAVRLGALSAALTWDRHPMQTLRPEAAPRLLSSPERRAELLESTALDLLAVLVFDTELSHWPPERFVQDVLVKELGVRSVTVGTGWRFGHRAAGDTQLLARLGDELGFEVNVLDLAEVAGGPASSSRAREAVAAGDMALARALLGRPFDLDGRVIRGDGRGASLGWPTANLEVDPALVRPAIGVYAGRARVGADWHRAAVNVGVNPTFGGDYDTSSVRVEAYLLDFEDDIYGEIVRLELHERLRDEMRFESADALVDQIGRDVEATRALPL